MPTGGHAPAAGGLAKAALKYVEQTGATAVQVYVSNPRGWALAAGDPKQDDAFLAGCAELGVAPYIHASLLVNLGSPTAATVERSVATLEHALRRGKIIGAAQGHATDIALLRSLRRNFPEVAPIKPPRKAASGPSPRGRSARRPRRGA